jgi:hypothetical protein
MGVAAGGDHRVVTEDFLHFEQVDTRFDQMASSFIRQCGVILFLNRSAR